MNSINIDPANVFIKVLSEKKQKTENFELAGTAKVFMKPDFGLTSSFLLVYYAAKSNIVNIYYPTISLNIGQGELLQENAFFIDGKIATLLHECGHILLLHTVETLILQIFKVNKLPEKLYEIEADCILPMLSKVYAEIKLKSILKNCITVFSRYCDQETEKNKLTFIFSDDRPSYFEQLIHILDICQQVWNISNFTEYFSEKDREDVVSMTYFNDNMLKIDQESKFYIKSGAVDLSFEFQVPRLQIPGKEVYNFMQQKN